VRDPDRWNHGGLGVALTDLLNYLTDDAWALTFVARRPAAARFSEAQPGLFTESPSAPATAALFSGGLDSLAGLAIRLATHPMETVVVFSGRTNKRIGAPQRTLLEAIAQAFPQRVRSIAVRFGFHRRTGGAYDLEETSQRTRGFVFQAFGAVTARMAGLDSLDVYENGVGAINLPYTGAQLGSQATRATHPVTLRLMSDLLTQAFEAPFSVELPYAFATKGEVCNGLRTAGLGHLARHSVSCDGYPQRAKRAPQCGVCPSCLLRRQSLYHARLLDDDPACLYMHDVYDASAPDALERRFSMRAMGGQIHHLRRALAAARPWEALVIRYPELDEAADALARPDDGGAAVREALVALYGRYCEEWDAFAARAMRTGDSAPDSCPAYEVEVRPEEPSRVTGAPADSVGKRPSQAGPNLWQSTATGGDDDG
jgi:7-cyano-7-deazaguanine synthase in queuosine biosynthesis